MAWKIKSKTKTLKKHGQPPEPRYWSDEFGWVTKENADTYTDDQKDEMTLALGSEWEQISGV